MNRKPSEARVPIMGMLGEGGTSQAEAPGWGWYSGKAPRSWGRQGEIGAGNHQITSALNELNVLDIHYFQTFPGRFSSPSLSCVCTAIVAEVPKG